MGSVTLIGQSLAKEGLEFRFGGCLSKCKECELKNSCCGLKKNKWYRVTDVRNKHHDCQVHHKRVSVVEVEEIPVKTTTSRRSVIEGSVITLDDKSCDEIGCDNYMLCHPDGIELDKKYNVESTDDDIKCPKGKDLTIVTLKSK